MVLLWLYRIYYYYYYYYHTVPHILIFSNKECSFLPNLQCAFCWFPCFPPLLPPHVLSLRRSPHSICALIPQLSLTDFFEVAALLTLGRVKQNLCPLQWQPACLQWDTPALICNATRCHSLLIHALLFIKQNTSTHWCSLVLSKHGLFNFVLWLPHGWF